MLNHQHIRNVTGQNHVLELNQVNAPNLGEIQEGNFQLIPDQQIDWEDEEAVIDGGEGAQPIELAIVRQHHVDAGQCNGEMTQDQLRSAVLYLSIVKADIQGTYYKEGKQQQFLNTVQSICQSLGIVENPIELDDIFGDEDPGQRVVTSGRDENILTVSGVRRTIMLSYYIKHLGDIYLYVLRRQNAEPVLNTVFNAFVMPLLGAGTYALSILVRGLSGQEQNKRNAFLAINAQIRACNGQEEATERMTELVRSFGYLLNTYSTFRPSSFFVDNQQNANAAYTKLVQRLHPENRNRLLVTAYRYIDDRVHLKTSLSNMDILLRSYIHLSQRGEGHFQLVNENEHIDEDDEIPQENPLRSRQRFQTYVNNKIAEVYDENQQLFY